MYYRKLFPVNKTLVYKYSRNFCSYQSKCYSLNRKILSSCFNKIRQGIYKRISYFLSYKITYKSNTLYHYYSLSSLSGMQNKCHLLHSSLKDRLTNIYLGKVLLGWSKINIKFLCFRNRLSIIHCKVNILQRSRMGMLNLYKLEHIHQGLLNQNGLSKKKTCRLNMSFDLLKSKYDKSNSKIHKVWIRGCS